MKKRIIKILRLILALAPLVWIFTRTDLTSAAGILKTVSPLLLMTILLFVFVTIVLQGFRWWILLKRFIPDLKMLSTLKIHLVSTFYAIVLPSSAAQDVVRSVILSRKYSSSVIWASSWIARLMGLFVLMLFSSVGISILKTETLSPNFRFSFFLVFGAALFMGIASFSKTITKPLRRIGTKFSDNRLVQFFSQLRNSIYDYKKAKITLLQALTVSITTQLFLIINASLVFYAVTGKFYFLESLAFIPLIEVVSISLPLTPGGIGVREGLLALMFSQLNLSADQLASYVAINLLISFSKLIGAMPLLYSIIKKKLKFEPSVDS
ncbi:MAG: YbhN family protein [Chitinispirillaceae bacterium]